MMNNKNIVIVVICVAALMGWSAFVNWLYPPVPKQARPVLPLTATSGPPVAVTHTVARIAPAPPVAPPDDHAPEQVVTLQNDFVRVAITSRGGGIQSVELLKHRANGHGHVVLNGAAGAPALALKDDRANYTVEQVGSREVVLRGPVTKRLTLGAEYLLTGCIEFGGATTQAVPVVVGTAVPADLVKEGEAFLGVDWLAHAKFQNRELKHARKGPGREETPARWVAVKSQFFTMILTPATNAVAVAYQPTVMAPPPNWKAKEPPHGLTAVAELPANATGRYEFTFYAGPKDYTRLSALGQGQEDVLQFGMWSVVSVILLKSMNFCYRLIPNYGVAIILITIAIKIVFWPIQAKSIQSMKAMQKFQPLMAKLKEKYKDDPQRMNAEMMKLYKEHKINPFSGCLPMLVQIPVFFALFAMLRSAIELRGTSFLWVKDLSQPDTVGQLFGLPINPLPLIMTGAMIWQQKITPTVGDPQQAKMMMFMPLMMLFFFYNASSGLALYWTVQQLLSIGQQWWSLRREDHNVTVIPPAKP